MKSRSRTDWARVDALTDDEIVLSEALELDESFFTDAVLRMPRRWDMVGVPAEDDRRETGTACCVRQLPVGMGQCTSSLASA
jgi:hypothetical protein